jgi:uncharacterized RDD family membrane protein YckC
MNEWFYADKGQRIGPISEDVFRAACVQGTVQANTPVWHAGMDDWQPLSAVEPTFLPSAVSTATVCSECGRTFPSGQLLAFQGAHLCPGCKDIYFQRLREQGSEAIRRSVRYGGFWIRAIALLIDGIIIGVATYPITFLIYAAFGVTLFNASRDVTPEMLSRLIAGAGFSFLINFAISLTYESWFWVNRGATPGKMIFGLQVLRPTGERLTWGRAIGRVFGRWLSSLTLGIGYLIAAFDSEKRALHDFVCDTRVAYK